MEAAVSAGRVREGLGLRAAEDDQPAWVMRVDPSDGASFVLRDTPVLLRVSHRLLAESVSADSVRVLDPQGQVSGQVRVCGDGRVVIWQAERLLTSGVEHVVIVRGVRDTRGRVVQEHWSRFVPCGLARAELSG